MPRRASSRAALARQAASSPQSHACRSLSISTLSETPLVKSKCWCDRYDAVWALSDLGDRAASPYLPRLAGDRDKSICRVAAVGLARIGSQQALESVASLLTHPDTDVRLAAAKMLHRAESVRANEKR